MNAYLLGHLEHRQEFEEHRSEFVQKWRNFVDHQEHHGGTPEDEKPLMETISSSSEAYFDESLALFSDYDGLQLQRTRLNQQIEASLQEISSLQDFHEEAANQLSSSTSVTTIDKSVLLFELQAEKDLSELLVNLLSLGSITGHYLPGNKSSQSKLAQLSISYQDTIEAYKTHIKSHSSPSATKSLSIEASISGFRAIEIAAIELIKSQDRIDMQWQQVDQTRDKLNELISDLVSGHNVEITSASAATKQTISLVILAATLLSIGSVLLLSRMIVTPIVQLKDVSVALGQREHGQRARVQSNDEIGNLGKAFNQMADDIENYQNELNSTHDELLRNERFVALGTLIATISHDIRNPLATIRAATYAIGKRLAGQETGVERTLDRVDRSIDRCENIIEALLDFTRTPELELKATNIDEWIEKILEEHPIDASIKLHQRLDSNTTLRLDQARFQGCIINTINNACQAMLEREDVENVEDAESNLTVSSKLDDQEVIISITDTGPGISKVHLDKIFEPMFSTRASGVGLGLPIVRKVMEQHNGRVEVNSLSGKGTTVTLCLPVNITEEN